MKGEKQVIERLNEALFLELGAVNQYWVHYRLLEDWGYTKLAKKERAESIEEMHHADKLVARIIFLEGHPNLQSLAPLRIGQNVKEVLEADLAGEYDARTSYKKSRDICYEAGDYVSMKLFEELLSICLPRSARRNTDSSMPILPTTPRAESTRTMKSCGAR
jgi:bacterioferritin